MKTNQKIKTAKQTHSQETLLESNKTLNRLVLANMLFEDQFYMNGQDSHALLAQEVAKTSTDNVNRLAELARTKFKLRHVPLAMQVALAKARRMTADGVNAVIQRADEMSEINSLS